MRSGIFAVYKGKEYKAAIKENGIVTLRSNSISDLKYGFTLYKNIIYVKNVNFSELTSIYYIITYANYKGCICEVIQEEQDKLLLYAFVGDYKILKKLGFQIVDNGVYSKWINYNEIDRIYEEKKLISI